MIKQLSTIVAYGRNRYLSLTNQIEAFATEKMKAKTKIWLKYGNRFLEGKYDVSGDFRVWFTCLFVSSTFSILIDFCYFHQLLLFSPTFCILSIFRIFTDFSYFHRLFAFSSTFRILIDLYHRLLVLSQTFGFSQIFILF